MSGFVSNGLYGERSSNGSTSRSADVDAGRANETISMNSSVLDVFSTHTVFEELDKVERLSWAIFAIILLSTGLRVLARSRTAQKLQLDDYLMLAAIVDAPGRGRSVFD